MSPTCFTIGTNLARGGHPLVAHLEIGLVGDEGDVLPLVDRVADGVAPIRLEHAREERADVRGGEVTTAVRDSQAADGSPIHAGDVMGIQDDSIDVVGSSVEQVTLDLIAKMQDEEEGDSLTILAGQDMDDEAVSSPSTR